MQTIQTSNPSVPEAVGRAMQLALENLKNWWYGNKEQTDAVNRQKPFFEIPPENFSAWNSRQLEYDFKAQIAPKDASGNLLGKLILDASGYKEDHLEWYSFTVSDESTEDFRIAASKSG